MLIAAMGMAALACSNKEEHSTSDLQTLPVTKLTTRDTVLHREYVGDIDAFRNVEIRARVQGYLDKIYVDEGQEVKKGQPLFQINNEEFVAALTQARANLKSTEAEAKAMDLEMQRVKVLVEKQVISKSELEVAEARCAAMNARIDEARSALSNAEIRLSHANIRAPFDGVIDRIPMKIGSLIDEGVLLTTVSDVQSIYAYFNVSEHEYLDYVKKKINTDDGGADEVELILADGTEYAYKGKIETIESEFETSTGTIAFRARFPNPDKLIRHGASGRIRLANEARNLLLVPQKATLEIQDKTYVFVVNDKNQVNMQSFVPRARFSHFYIVETGLKPGDRVVYEGIQNIRNGMEITPSDMPLDSLILLTAHESMSPTGI